MKYFIIFFFAIIAFGRENPFFPINGSDDLNYTTNQIIKLPPFRKTTIDFPPTARVLESVIVEYKNLDGSITQKKIEINESIDWHKPLIVQQLQTQIQFKQQKKIKQQKKNYFKKIAKLSFISFYVDGMKLKIVTQDRLLRNFMLIKPDRIVLDFKRDIDFRTKSYFFKKIFKKITIGNHSRYYRVVLYLDGKYLYKIKKYKGYYIVELL